MRVKPVVKAGNKFGRWTALEDARTATRSYVMCRCTCGTERAVEAKSLQTGNSRSCGCLRIETLRAPRTDMYIRAGEQSGRWTALENSVWSDSEISCRCTCGTVKAVSAISFRHGRSQSCGCLAREIVMARNQTHGLCHHPLYHIWHQMVVRCSKPSSVSYLNYGGRGITVCDRWQALPEGLLNFAADMGPRPGLEYTVDRIDNDGNYEPGNCRWATAAEQAANMRPRAHRAEVDAVLAENDQLRQRIIELETRLAAVGLSL